MVEVQQHFILRIKSVKRNLVIPFNNKVLNNHGKINGKINENEKPVISIIKNDKYITISEIAMNINKSITTTY